MVASVETIKPAEIQSTKPSQYKLNPVEAKNAQRWLINNFRTKAIAWSLTALAGLGAAGYSTYKTFSPSGDYATLNAIDNQQERERDYYDRMRERIDNANINTSGLYQNNEHEGVERDVFTGSPLPEQIMQNIPDGEGGVISISASLNSEQQERLSKLEMQQLGWGVGTLFLLAVGGVAGYQGRKNAKEVDRAKSGESISAYVDSETHKIIRWRPLDKWEAEARMREYQASINDAPAAVK